MTDGFSSMIEQVKSFTPMQIAIIGVVTLVIWFIPTFLGLIRNRKHIGKIFLLNIPAAFTFTSWFLLMGLVLIKFDSFGELKDRFLKRGKKKDGQEDQPALAE
ncbi:hypothetical protein [Parvularcula sp. IMCC14364]|uniref:hypothetical protein n=1 Tax=Parvularcula sp. IMCC14364 TaxID=3067902 RepID=UPI002741A472|nr:hypothetical protein [Parvularcula sp. IMCC14364]